MSIRTLTGTISAVKPGKGWFDPDLVIVRLSEPFQGATEFTVPASKMTVEGISFSSAFMHGGKPKKGDSVTVETYATDHSPRAGLAENSLFNWRFQPA